MMRNEIVGREEEGVHGAEFLLPPNDLVSLRAVTIVASMMRNEIVGREEELGSVYAFLDGAVEGAAGFVLEGEPGIGKSTLWLAAVTGARDRGFLVLSSRPAEAERSLAHIGLGDLFEDVLDDVLPALSVPRRHALEVALLREEALGDPVDQRALAVAVRSVLQLLSERELILIAVDDVQWLDPSSSSALAFALRRLGANSVRLLLARRLGERIQPAGLEQALDSERVERLSVGPLSVGALHRLLLDRIGIAFARQTLLRIHETSGGNPFFALELARAAALGTPSQSLLERAGVAADALVPAVVAHVIERENGTIRFTHPLLSSVLYRDLGEERQSVHGRIAGIVEDPLLRARHLALATELSDADVAAVLDDAARLAVERGASAVAAEQALPADAAGRARGAPSSGAGCSSCAQCCRGVDACPEDRDRTAGRDGHRAAARRGTRPARRAGGAQACRLAARG